MRIRKTRKVIEKLKMKIISSIINRSENNNVPNEISKDIGKVELKPKNLIVIDYIDKKISNKNKKR